MLNKNSIEELKRFCERHRDYVPYNPTDEVLEVTLRKMQANKNGVYPKIRNEAKRWLRERGYSEIVAD